ncbi:hypothetical protein C8F01DRAFT_292385, partial [Mycena amicta]
RVSGCFCIRRLSSRDTWIGLTLIVLVATNLLNQAQRRPLPPGSPFLLSYPPPLCHAPIPRHSFTRYRRRSDRCPSTHRRRPRCHLYCCRLQRQLYPVRFSGTLRLGASQRMRPHDRPVQQERLECARRHGRVYVFLVCGPRLCNQAARHQRPDS